jgi:hypothetical protein
MLTLVMGGINAIKVPHRQVGKITTKCSFVKLIYTNKQSIYHQKKKNDMVCDNTQTLHTEYPDLMDHYYGVLVFNWAKINYIWSSDHWILVHFLLDLSSYVFLPSKMLLPSFRGTEVLYSHLSVFMHTSSFDLYN